MIIIIVYYTCTYIYFVIYIIVGIGLISSFILILWCLCRSKKLGESLSLVDNSEKDTNSSHMNRFTQEFLQPLPQCSQIILSVPVQVFCSAARKWIHLQMWCYVCTQQTHSPACCYAPCPLLSHCPYNLLLEDVSLWVHWNTHLLAHHMPMFWSLWP